MYKIYKLVRTYKQRGDTIIEVMLAMAVIGMVLGVAYGIANRSVAIGRSAQERSEALKFAESQVELIKQYVSEQSRAPGESIMDMLSEDTKLNVSGSPDSACFAVDSGSGDVIVQKIQNSITTLGDACEFGGLYQVSVVCTSGVPSPGASLIALAQTCSSSTPAASQRKILVRVVWERIGGRGEKDKLDLYYRYGG